MGNGNFDNNHTSGCLNSEFVIRHGQAYDSFGFFTQQDLTTAPNLKGMPCSAIAIVALVSLFVLLQSGLARGEDIIGEIRDSLAEIPGGEFTMGDPSGEPGDVFEIDCPIFGPPLVNRIERVPEKDVRIRGL